MTNPDAPDLTTKRQYFTKKEAFTSHETDRLAHEAATSPYNDLPEPTLEQKISGDYVKGHLLIASMPIAIENPQRSVRSGTDADGTEWSITMKTHYGYFEGTKGADGDEVDVILMPGTEPDFSGNVYVIAQNDPKTGEFDEHKVVLGAVDIDQAIEAYHANYSDDWKGFGGIKAMSMDEFQNWLQGAPDRMMFDGIGGDIRLVTEQDIQADPLAVLDLCVGVLQANTAIVVIGNELGDFPDTEDGKKALRLAAREEFKKMLGDWIDCPSLDSVEGIGAKVEIRNRGIKEFMAFSGDPRKLKLVAAIAQVIKTAKLPSDGWQDNEKKEKKPNVVGYYHLKNTVMVDGESIEVSVLIEKDDKGLLHYDVIVPKKDSAEFDSVETKKSDQRSPDNYSGGRSDMNIESQAADLVNSADFDEDADFVVNMFISGHDFKSTVRVNPDAPIDPNYSVIDTFDPESDKGKLSLAIEAQRRNRKHFASARGKTLQNRTELTNQYILSPQKAKASQAKLIAMYADEIAAINRKYGNHAIQVGYAKNLMAAGTAQENSYVLVIGLDWLELSSVLDEDEQASIIDSLTGNDHEGYYFDSPPSVIDPDGEGDELTNFSTGLDDIESFTALTTEKDAEDVMEIFMRWFGLEKNTYERSLNHTLFDSFICYDQSGLNEVFEKDGLTFLSRDSFDLYEKNQLRARTPRGYFLIPAIRRALLHIEGFDNGESDSLTYSSSELGDFIVYFSRDAENSLVVIKRPTGEYVCGWPVDSSALVVRKIVGVLGVPITDVVETMFDSFLADGRYDHIRLDDLQMHPYANAAKERQPTASTPLLVQKNRRGDLYLIAGVKRYEMALNDDLEFLPAVILPVVEGYGDPIIKRVLSAYTGSIDPLALMAAIEDAVTERAGKKAMFDGLGGDISTITDLDIQNDPLGVLEACLVALENPTGFDVNNPATILRYVSKIIDQLATASDAQKAISLDYIGELQILMRNTDYNREEFRKIVRKLTETVLVEASTNTQKLVMNEYMDGGGTLVYDLELYKSAETYQRAMNESISHRNAQINEAWKVRQSEVKDLWKQLTEKASDPLISDEQLNELKIAYDKQRMPQWEVFSAAYVDAWRPEKERIEAEMKGKGQQLINDVLSASKVSTDAATQWAAQQIITTAAEKQLVKMGYPVDQVRKDLAEFYQVTNGAISHIGIDYSGKKDRAYTINSTHKVADKWMYIGGHFDKRVLFHEAGHHIESDKAALAASTYFLKFKRGSDDKLYRLSNLAPGWGYGSSELAYKGSFFNPYVGKYYEHGPTEVWSMGVESLYDPVVLAERAAVDPQMFAMIMGGIKLPKNPLVEVSDAIFSEQMKQQGAKKEDAEKLREDAIKKIVSLVTFDKTPVPNVEQALFYFSPKYHSGSTFHGRYNDWYVFAVQSVRNRRTNRLGKGYICLEYKKRNEYSDPDIIAVDSAGKLDADEIKLYVAALSVSELLSARQVAMGRLSDERVQEILSKLTGGSNE